VNCRLEAGEHLRLTLGANMTNELEKDYDTLMKEMKAKVNSAIELLKEARDIRYEIQYDSRYWDDFDELKDVVKDLIPFPESKAAWESSSWCVGDYD
jgi:hypothetical protein